MDVNYYSVETHLNRLGDKLVRLILPKDGDKKRAIEKASSLLKSTSTDILKMPVIGVKRCFGKACAYFELELKKAST